MKTYTYEQIIQERKREYLELLTQIKSLQKYIEKTKNTDDYQLDYIGYFGTQEPNLVIYVDEHYHLLEKGMKKLIDKLGIPTVKGKNIFLPSQKLSSEYFIGRKKVIQITDLENFRKDMEKILNSELALELKQYDNNGIIEQYSLNDYLMVHTSSCTKVFNGKIELFHDYFPESLLFTAENNYVDEKKAIHLFKEEYPSSLFSDYFQSRLEKQDTLEYQMDESLNGRNLNGEHLTGTISQKKILIHSKNKR